MALSARVIRSERFKFFAAGVSGAVTTQGLLSRGRRSAGATCIRVVKLFRTCLSTTCVHPTAGNSLWDISWFVYPKLLSQAALPGDPSLSPQYTKDLGDGGGVGERRWDKGRWRRRAEECHITTAYFARRTSGVDDQGDR